MGDKTACGDSMQSTLSRLAEYVNGLGGVPAGVPYEVCLAAIEAEQQVETWTELRRADARSRDVERVTHGRHCVCSSCAREDWSNSQLAPCGMHGPTCPGVYAPLGSPGESVRRQLASPREHDGGAA